MEQASLLFWIICVVMVLGTVAAVVAPLLRRNDDSSRVDTDMDIYKSQLAEVERDLARGVLAEDEAERTRTEIARRLLAADKAERGAPTQAPGIANLALAGVLGVGLTGAAVWGYMDLGAPGYPDMPRAERIARADAARRERMGQLQAEALVENKFAAPIQVPQDALELIDQLRQVVPTRPEDVNGWQLLSDNEARVRNFAAAAEAQTRVNTLKGAEATEPDRYLQVFYLFMAADGAVSPDLQSLINELAPDRDIRTEMWGAIALDARSLGHFSAATRAQERFIATRGEDAETRDYEDLLDYMVSATNGFVSPEAETVAVRLLQQDEDNVVALYYAGLLYAQTDRPDRAFNFLRRVIDLAEPDSLHYLLASRMVEQAAWLAGEDYTLPGAETRGPSAEDMANAADMSAEDRDAMIEGMVANLSQRLAEEGGTPEEWAQLIRALGVLGETDRAAAIWAEAQEVYAGSDAAIATIRDAARAAGVAE